MNKKTDVIVIGGGHAGVEAAAAAARMGASVSLVTVDEKKIGVMSCNPAIGGIGKGHIVKEIDAMGGIMPISADKAGIQFKLLNSSKGPAVRGVRCQADRDIYKQAVQEELRRFKNITIVRDMVSGLKFSKKKCVGVNLENGNTITAASVVITTGTFLNGMIYLGDKKTPAGRINESPSNKLGEFLKGLGLPMARLKTGTPPRIFKKSINFNILEKDEGDNFPEFFSIETNKVFSRQVPCYTTWTNQDTHDLIKKSIKESPLYNGTISTIGPRYCPSIEDKVYRFFDRKRHRVMLEPEGLNSSLIYPNRISTSLPEKVQIELIRTIKGLEEAKISQMGYAIEYDHVDPRELKRTLESKTYKNLFFAGQINGTTGYEEAAGQGLIAGVNAVLSINDNYKSLVLDRTESYIGVMIDDLTTRGAPEPYRMFTSRAEYRLYLRSDNSDLRLSDKAILYNLLPSGRIKKFLSYKKDLEELKKICTGIKVTPNNARDIGLNLSLDGKKRSLLDVLGFEGLDKSKLFSKFANITRFNKRVLSQLEIQSKYGVHLKKQKSSLFSYKRDQNIKIPKSINYKIIGGLSKESCDALELVRPEDMASASKIPGVTAAALSSVLLYTKKR